MIDFATMRSKQFTAYYGWVAAQRRLGTNVATRSLGSAIKFPWSRHLDTDHDQYTTHKQV